MSIRKNVQRPFFHSGALLFATFSINILRSVGSIVTSKGNQRMRTMPNWPDREYLTTSLAAEVMRKASCRLQNGAKWLQGFYWWGRLSYSWRSRWTECSTLFMTFCLCFYDSALWTHYSPHCSAKFYSCYYKCMESFSIIRKLLFYQESPTAGMSTVHILHTVNFSRSRLHFLHTRRNLSSNWRRLFYVLVAHLHCRTGQLCSLRHN